MSALSVILTPFAKLILLFYSITGSYGVSLLLFALVIRLILFPVFLKGRKSMLSMSGLAEKQQELAKKYARNREKYSQELAKLYEEEGVKPSGGCLWSCATTRSSRPSRSCLTCPSSTLPSWG